MKYETSVAILALLGLVSALPTQPALPKYRLRGREVPQEHSHNVFLDSVGTSLNKNNPNKIIDPVFGLLGSAAAAAGQGTIADVDCLHLATADQAFSNAKAAGDVAGMTDALIFAALERNTGKVGLASVLCTSLKAVNPEVGAIQQHQDPASPGAAAHNKAVTLELAKQIASVGGDPQQALKAGTFAPGNLDDNTAKGNSCDVENDEPGCIFTQNLLVEDATAAEIDAAVKGVSGAAPATPAAATTSSADATSACAAASVVTVTAAPAAAAVADDANACPAQVTSTVTVAADAAAAATPAPAAPAATTAAAAASASSSSSGTNVQKFTGALGGLPPPVIFTQGADRPFETGGDTFLNQGAATQRSCSVQHNKCSDAANSGALAGGQAQCETQETACNAANA